MDDEELGPFRRVDPAAVDDDPFWSVVRRRHPDVDIVLLPSDGAGHDGASEPPEPPEPSPEQVRALVDEARTAWGLVSSLLVDPEESAQDAEPSVRWSGDPGGSRLLVQKALRSLGQDGGTQLLRELTLVLGQAGWRLRVSTHQDRPLLEAIDRRSHVRAEAGPGATVFTLTTVGPAGAGREAVTSWR